MSAWCTFAKHSPGTINRELGDRKDWPEWNEKEYKKEIEEIALRVVGEVPVTINNLPYPARPQFNPRGWPSFCYTPETCKGRSSCPKPHACND